MGLAYLRYLQQEGSPLELVEIIELSPGSPPARPHPRPPSPDDPHPEHPIVLPDPPIDPPIVPPGGLPDAQKPGWNATKQGWQWSSEPKDKPQPPKK